MFLISVEDTGNHPDHVLSAIKKCLQQSFRKLPENLSETRDSIAEKLRQTKVMGKLYRYLWVDQMTKNYFIIIATTLEDGMGRGKPILAWAVRRKTERSLAELCLEVISDSVSDLEDINKLGLPTSLETEAEEFFKNLSL